MSGAVRVVAFEPSRSKWVMHSSLSGGGTRYFLDGTLAVSRATSELQASPTGGQLVVYDRTGALERNEMVATTLVSPTHAVRAQASSAATTTASHQETLSEALRGAQDVHKKTTSSAKRFFFWFSFLPANVAAALLTPAVLVYGTSPMGMFFATLPLAGAALVLVLGIVHVKIGLQAALWWATGGLIASTWGAFELGQQVPDLAAAASGVPGGPPQIMLAEWIGTVLSVCWSMYGPFGFLISVGLGVIYGLSAARILRAMD